MKRLTDWTFDSRSVSSASRQNQLPLCGYVQRDICDLLIHYASLYILDTDNLAQTITAGRSLCATVSVTSDRDFPLCHRPDLLRDPSSFLLKCWRLFWGWGGGGCKRHSETDCSTESSAGVKNALIYTSTSPYAFMENEKCFVLNKECSFAVHL